MIPEHPTNSSLSPLQKSRGRTLDEGLVMDEWLGPLAPGSRRQYRQAVRALGSFAGWARPVEELLGLSSGEAVVLLERWASSSGLARTTRQQRVGAVCSLLKYYQRVGLGGPGAVTVRVSGESHPPQTRAASSARVRAELARMDAEPGIRPARDAAIVSVLATMGLRRSECSGLKLEKIDWEASEAMVLRKGNRWEALRIPAATMRRVQRWRRHVPWDAGPLWGQISRCGGFVCAAGLTADSIAKLTLRLRIGTPHDIRRMAGRWAVKHGGDGGPADMESLRGFMGHRSLVATTAYTRSQGDSGADIRCALDSELSPENEEKGS